MLVDAGPPRDRGLSKRRFLRDPWLVQRWARIATIFAMTSICAPARASDVDLACARLSPGQADELRARIKLILRSATDAPRSILVACDAQRAWVVWNAPPPELLETPGDGELVEALLDAIEKRAQRSPHAEAPAPKPRARPVPTSPHETPTWEQRVPPVEPPKPFVESGGMGLALAGELLRGPLGSALGPRLDIGVGWGPWSLQLTESARFARTDTGSSALLYDLGAGVGWGAPFSRKHPLGAALLGGSEWLHVHGHTVTTGFAALDLRAALPVGPLSIALGVEGRARFSPQSVSERESVEGPRWSGLLFLGGVLLVEPSSR